MLLFRRLSVRGVHPLEAAGAGLMDVMACRICHPTVESGHKHLHVVKYQAVMCTNSIICQLDGPYKGRRHDGVTLFYSVDCLMFSMQSAKSVAGGQVHFQRL